MARRSKDEAEETREHIIDAAIKLFLANGVSRTTLEKIAQEAGYTRGAVYHHFENKATLLKELHKMIKPPAEELLTKFSSLHSANPIDGLKQGIMHVLEEMELNRRIMDIHAIFFHNCEYVDRTNPIAESERTHAQAIQSMVSKIMATAQELGVMKKDIDPENASMALQSYCYGIFALSARHYISGENTCIIKDISGALDLFFNSLRTCPC